MVKKIPNSKQELAAELDIHEGVANNVCVDAPDPATAPQKEIEALFEFAELV